MKKAIQTWSAGLALALWAQAAAGAPSGGKKSGLRVDPAHPRYLLYNGRPFYLIGSGMESICQPWSRSREQWRRYLDMLRRNGFNRVRFFPWDLCWQKELLPAFSPWAVRDAKAFDFELTRFNPAYWRLVKSIVKMAEERDIAVEYILFDYCCLRDGRTEKPWSRCPLAAANGNGGAVPGGIGKPGVCLFADYNDLDLFRRPFRPQWDWKKRNQWIQQAYVKHTLDQLGGFPNIYWEIMNEQGWGKVEPDGVRWTRHWLAFLDKHDSRRHLRSINAADVYDQMRGIDIVCEHPIPFFHKGELRTPEAAVSVIARNLRFGKPVVCDETGFFPPPGSTADETWRRSSPEQLANERRAFWFSFVAGGHWTAACWQDFRERDTHRWARHLAEFVRLVNYREMDPHDDLVKGGHCLARLGREYALYTGWGARMEVDLSALGDRRALARWFDPRTGKLTRASAVGEANGRKIFEPPSREDWALWIVAASSRPRRAEGAPAEVR
ncbi:MAG: hypothetical protein J7M29_01110 [Verrucomicrobia bacterium]|nr:hypothetical protein [Verrucomicrobiota bacterium]